MEPSQMAGRVFDLRHKRLVSLEGFELYVMPNDYIGSHIAQVRSHEDHVTRVVRHELRAGDVFLDLGANIGYFSMLASALVGSAGKVIAFEPNPQNLQLIDESRRRNRFDHLTVYPYAVSDRSETLRFKTIGSNGVVVTDESADQCSHLVVQSVVLDRFLPAEPRLDLVKMDIEAHEPAALRGMSALLRRHRPKLLTEYHPWALRTYCADAPEKYLHQLAELGYRVSVILPNGDLAAMRSPEDVMSYWATLKSETAHLDLFAEPRAA